MLQVASRVHTQAQETDRSFRGKMGSVSVESVTDLGENVPYLRRKVVMATAEGKTRISKDC